MIHVATDCSGLEAPLQALANLGIPFVHEFSCDFDAEVEKMIKANFNPKKFYKDVTTRSLNDLPQVHLYIAGFPCQPFSTAGVQCGFDDPRGLVFFHIVRSIAKMHPRVFILENVTGLLILEQGIYMESILFALNELEDYDVSYQTLNTSEHGVPQNRPRVYIVGILKEFATPWQFPRPIPCPSLELFLDSRDPHLAQTGRPPLSQLTAWMNRNWAFYHLQISKGLDPTVEPYVVNVDSSEDHRNLMCGVSPCMTRSRYEGHWLMNRGRRMNKGEMFRMQGMDPRAFKVVVSEKALGQMIGNSMSINVLERLMAEVLPASGLVRPDQVQDRWVSGAAQLALANSRNFKVEFMNSRKRRRQ